MVADYAGGCGLRREQARAHGFVNLARRTLAEAPRLRDFAPEEGMFLAIAQVERADRIRHSPAGDHCACQRRRLTNVVIRTGADGPEQLAFRHAAGQHHGKAIRQIGFGQCVALHFG